MLGTCTSENMVALNLHTKTELFNLHTKTELFNLHTKTEL
jgi:hypothetical protein